LYHYHNHTAKTFNRQMKSGDEMIPKLYALDGAVVQAGHMLDRASEKIVA